MRAKITRHAPLSCAGSVARKRSARPQACAKRARTCGPKSRSFRHLLAAEYRFSLSAFPVATPCPRILEWVAAYDDEKLGFNKVAKYYYTPGVMELEANNVIVVNKAAWAALPPRYQAALRYAGYYNMTEMLASYDAKNAQAITRLVASGTQLSVLPEEVIKALRGALESVLDEEAAANEQFKRILTSWRKFRADQHRWFSIADTRADLAVYRSGA